MIDLFGPLRRLASAVRRLFSRRAARRLVSGELPRGLLPAPARPLALAVRVPASPAEGEFTLLPLFAHAVRGKGPARLLKLSALPALVRPLHVLREPPVPWTPRLPLAPARLVLRSPLSSSIRELAVLRPALWPGAPLLPAAPLAPARLQLVRPLGSAVLDLGVARPTHFRLDAELRLPPEVDPLRIAPDAPPPARTRRVRPRTPLARAPIWRLRMRPFRLDPRSAQGPNEGILPLAPRDTSYRWVLPAFRKQFVDLPAMARFQVAFRGPMAAEWFQRWWDQVTYHAPGAKEPRYYKLGKEISWAMEERKEQMLIRRDVKKDEDGPPFQDFSHLTLEHAITAREFFPLDDLIPPKEWVEVADIALPPAELEVTPREAYLQWRTLMAALEER